MLTVRKTASADLAFATLQICRHLQGFSDLRPLCLAVHRMEPSAEVSDAQIWIQNSGATLATRPQTATGSLYEAAWEDVGTVRLSQHRNGFNLAMHFVADSCMHQWFPNAPDSATLGPNLTFRIDAAAGDRPIAALRKFVPPAKLVVPSTVQSALPADLRALLPREPPHATGVRARQASITASFEVSLARTTPPREGSAGPAATAIRASSFFHDELRLGREAAAAAQKTRGTSAPPASPSEQSTVQKRREQMHKLLDENQQELTKETAHSETSLNELAAGDATSEMDRFWPHSSSRSHERQDGGKVATEAGKKNGEVSMVRETEERQQAEDNKDDHEEENSVRRSKRVAKLKLPSGAVTKAGNAKRAHVPGPGQGSVAEASNRKHQQSEEPEDAGLPESHRVEETVPDNAGRSLSVRDLAAIRTKRATKTFAATRGRLNTGQKAQKMSTEDEENGADKGEHSYSDTPSETPAPTPDDPRDLDYDEIPRGTKSKQQQKKRPGKVAAADSAARPNKRPRTTKATESKGKTNQMSAKSKGRRHPLIKSIPGPAERDTPIKVQVTASPNQAHREQIPAHEDSDLQDRSTPVQEGSKESSTPRLQQTFSEEAQRPDAIVPTTPPRQTLSTYQLIQSNRDEATENAAAVIRAVNMAVTRARSEEASPPLQRSRLAGRRARFSSEELPSATSAQMPCIAKRYLAGDSAVGFDADRAPTEDQNQPSSPPPEDREYSHQEQRGDAINMPEEQIDPDGAAKRKRNLSSSSPTPRPLRTGPVDAPREKSEEQPSSLDIDEAVKTVLLKARRSRKHHQRALLNTHENKERTREVENTTYELREQMVTMVEVCADPFPRRLRESTDLPE